MTREQFIEEVNDFQTLIEFCYDRNIDTCDYVKCQEEFDEYIEECLYEWVRYDGWREVRDRLQDIPTGWDFYDTEYDFSGVDYEFDEYKSRVLSEADEKDIWSEEEYEPSEVDYSDVDDKVDGDELLEQFICLSA